MATSSYVKRFDMLLFIRSEFLQAIDNLSEIALFHLQSPKEFAKDHSGFGRVLERFVKFSIEYRELDRPRYHESRRSDMIDIYELLPHNHRSRLEDAALAGMSPSSILRFDGSDDTSFTASVALAIANWDTVLDQAWRLHIDATNRYEVLTTKWLDRVLHCRNKQKKRLETLREVWLETELAITAVINEGLYKAPENSHLANYSKKRLGNFVCFDRIMIPSQIACPDSILHDLGCLPTRQGRVTAIQSFSDGATTTNARRCSKDSQSRDLGFTNHCTPRTT